MTADQPETRAAERLKPGDAAMIDWLDAAARNEKDADQRNGLRRIRQRLFGLASAISARPEPRPAGEVRSGDGGGLRTMAESMRTLSAWLSERDLDMQLPQGLTDPARVAEVLAAQTEQPEAGQTAPADAVREALKELHRETVAAAKRAGTTWPLSGPARALEDRVLAALSTASVHGKGGLLIRATDAGQINRPGHRVVAFDNGCLAPILMEVAERSILEETRHA